MHDRLIGLGLAFLFVTIREAPDAYTRGVRIDFLNVLGFGAQWIVLVTIGIVAPLDDFRLRGKVLVQILLTEYVAFMCVNLPSP